MFKKLKMSFEWIKILNNLFKSNAIFCFPYILPRFWRFEHAIISFKVKKNPAFNTVKWLWT